MIAYVVLALTALTSTVQSIFKQRFNEKCKGSAYFFSAISAFCAMIFFIAVNRDPYYSAELILPSAAFAVTYAMALVFGVLAILYGPLAKTSLISSCSLLIPSFYGIIVLKDPVSPTLLPGIALLLAALVCVNVRKKDDENDKKITLKWVIFVVLAFVGNGMCSTVQKIKQIRYGNAGNNMFMIVALAMVVVILTVAALSFKGQREAIKATVKHGWLLALLAGIANGLTNYFVIFLNPRVPASVLFPVVSGGGLVLIFLWSTLVKKERFSTIQYTGYALGVASIVLLNL